MLFSKALDKELDFEDYLCNRIPANNMNVFKADPKTDISYYIGFAILIGASILLSVKLSTIGWALCLALLSVFIGFKLFTSRLTEIHLDKTNSKLILNYRNYLGARRTMKYDLSKIEFTYKRQSTSMRGGVKDICSIFLSDNKEEELVPGTDGWSNNEIGNFVNGLLDANVTKKFVGDTLKDAET